MTSERPERALAAEFVLGLLEGEERAAVERRLGSDAAFAREVEAWRTRFAELDDTAQEQAPRADLWAGIERALLAPVAVEPAAPGWLARAWSSLAALRLAATGSALVAVVCAVLAATALQHARETAARKPVYVAILVDDASRQAGAIVNAFADGRVEMIPLVDMPVPAGRALQVWTLWNREVGPRPIGLLSNAHATRLDLTSLPSTAPNQLFEITLEPATGSPTGRPTGPILYKGTTVRTL
jgi:anti-sigma-K factor RskA